MKTEIKCTQCGELIEEMTDSNPVCFRKGECDKVTEIICVDCFIINKLTEKKKS